MKLYNKTKYKAVDPTDGKMAMNSFKALKEFKRGMRAEPWLNRFYDIISKIYGGQPSPDVEYNLLYEKLDQECQNMVQDQLQMNNESWNLRDFIMDVLSDHPNPVQEHIDVQNITLTPGNYMSQIHKIEAGLTRCYNNDERKTVDKEIFSHDVAKTIISALLKGDPNTYRTLVANKVINPLKSRHNLKEIKEALRTIDIASKVTSQKPADFQKRYHSTNEYPQIQNQQI